MNRLVRLTNSDIIGVAASGLCALHCAIAPLIFATRPFVKVSVDYGHDHHGFGIWAIMDYLFMAISFFAVRYSAKQNQHKVLKWVLWAAWVVFTMGLALEAFAFENGVVLMYTGSFVLIIAHSYSHRYCKRIKVSNFTPAP